MSVHVAVRGASKQPLPAQFASAAMSAGLIVNAATPTTVRITPPLIIGVDQLDTIVDALLALLDVTSQEAPS